MKKETTIKAWGNSYGILIPRLIFEMKKWKVGQKLDITFSKDGLILKERSGS